MCSPPHCPPVERGLVKIWNFAWSYDVDIWNAGWPNPSRTRVIKSFLQLLHASVKPRNYAKSSTGTNEQLLTAFLTIVKFSPAICWLSPSHPIPWYTSHVHILHLNDVFVSEPAAVLCPRRSGTWKCGWPRDQGGKEGGEGEEVHSDLG